jgi:hypothetical protein
MMKRVTILSNGEKCCLTDLILLSWTKAMDISAWSMMNSTAFAPASCYALDLSNTIGFDKYKTMEKKKQAGVSYSFILLLANTF